MAIQNSVSNQVLLTTSSPAFNALTLTSALTVANGGSGRNTATAYALLAAGTTATGIQQSLGTGTAGQVLQSNGASALPSFVDLSGLGVTSITGTANQVLANATTGTLQLGAVTLTTPQDIATSSTPQFAGAYFGSPTGAQATAAGTIQVVGLGGLNGSATLASYWNGGAGSAPTLWTYKSRSATVGAFTTVQAGDELGRWEAYADDGTAFSRAAEIVVNAQGTISTGIIPGYFTFRTTNAAGAITTAMVIDSAQVITLTNALTVANGGSGRNTATAYALIAAGTTATGIQQSLGTGTAGQVLQSNGASALPSFVNLSGLGVTSITGTANQIAVSASTGAVTISIPTNPTLSGQVTATNYIATTGTFQANNGGFLAGNGSFQANLGNAFVGISAGASLGSLSMYCSNNAGNYANVLTNASTTAARTWTLPDATGTFLMTGLAISTVPSIAFSSTSGVIGTATNDSAAAGSMGELNSTVVLAGSAVSLSTGATSDIATLVLQPGDYDVWGEFWSTANAATLTASVVASIGTTTATIASTPSVNTSTASFNVALAAGVNITLPIASCRISVPTATTTTVYLCANSVFSVNTLSGYGKIMSRRRR